jgi:hypothetical protein
VGEEAAHRGPPNPEGASHERDARRPDLTTPDLHLDHPTHLADLVGRGVAYEHGDIDPRHGTIVSANYSLGGETVLIVHPDSRTCEVLANTVLMGRDANWALEHLDSPAEALSVDQAARRRLGTEQARTIPGAETSAPTPAVSRW